jgi:hypothetical protein
MLRKKLTTNNSNNMKISEIEQVFKDVFEEEEGKVSSVESVYEISKDEKFYKLVISIQNLSTKDTSIIHTKFMFKTDLKKTKIIENDFLYLFDINCVYHKVEFENIVDLKKKIEDIIESNDFGQDIQILSDFIEAPAMFLNYYMRRSKITDYSVFDVEYEPKFKTSPCDQVSFDFKININDNYHFELSIQKKESQSKDEPDIYKFQFKFLDEYKTIENDTLRNIHFTIGSNIAKILDEKLM